MLFCMDYITMCFVLRHYSSTVYNTFMFFVWISESCILIEWQISRKSTEVFMQPPRSSTEGSFIYIQTVTYTTNSNIQRHIDRQSKCSKGNVFTKQRYFIWRSVSGTVDMNYSLNTKKDNVQYGYTYIVCILAHHILIS